MDDIILSDLIEEIRGIREELRIQNENMKEFSEELMKRLKEIANELSA